MKQTDVYFSLHIRKKKRIMRLAMNTPEGIKLLRNVKLNIAEYRMLSAVMPLNGYRHYSFPDEVTDFVLSYVKESDFDAIPER